MFSQRRSRAADGPHSAVIVWLNQQQAASRRTVRGAGRHGRDYRIVEDRHGTCVSSRSRIWTGNQLRVFTTLAATEMAQPFWVLAARSAVWLAGAGLLALLQKPDGASFLAVRTDPIGWLGRGIFLAGLALHLWSNASLAHGERQRSGEASPLVSAGAFRYVRNPIYLAGIMLLLGVGLMYSPSSAVAIVAPMLILVIIHVRVVRAEEPALRGRFGPDYEEYCRRVRDGFLDRQPAQPSISAHRARRSAIDYSSFFATPEASSWASCGTPTLCDHHRRS